jgi:hypothetical protein
MGPITLFDKSFLQSLSVNESVWFDHFFLTVISPLFYVETLADLQKNVRTGRTVEEEVGLIAEKFPEMHGTPNVFHGTIRYGEFRGNRVPLDGRIIVPGGRPFQSEGRQGVFFEQTSEVTAFHRWQRREFREVERLYAKKWRQALVAPDRDELRHKLRTMGIDYDSCKTLEKAKEHALHLVNASEPRVSSISSAIATLRLPINEFTSLRNRWAGAGRPSLNSYAPYNAFVHTIECFSNIAMAKGLISHERASSQTDLAYLYYLPFSMIFVSSDRLHRDTAALFMRSDQEFVWGEDLKRDLGRINVHFEAFSEVEKKKGVMSFAPCVPLGQSLLTEKIYDRHVGPDWRRATSPAPHPSDPELVAATRRMEAAKQSSPSRISSQVNPDSMILSRRIGKKKGSWYQVPASLET